MGRSTFCRTTCLPLENMRSRVACKPSDHPRFPNDIVRPAVRNRSVEIARRPKPCFYALRSMRFGFAARGHLHVIISSETSIDGVVRLDHPAKLSGKIHRLPQMWLRMHCASQGLRNPLQILHLQCPALSRRRWPSSREPSPAGRWVARGPASQELLVGLRFFTKAVPNQFPKHAPRWDVLKLS